VENFIEIKKKARYQSLGNPSASKVLFVLHGYGQLAEYFIKNFESLSLNDFYIIAPEGMHRFYLSGSSGRVGASWMTKELRELDIIENIDYLEQLHDSIFEKNSEKSFHLLGFSQGGATATRWLAKSTINFNSFILWACVFPEDILVDFSKIDKNLKKYFVLGKNDPYFEGDNFTKVIDFYKKLNFELILFEGEHKIEEKSLFLIFEQQ
jgi:predicted esterase